MSGIVKDTFAIDNIAGFEFTCFLPPVASYEASNSEMASVARMLYPRLLQVLREARFFEEDLLKLQLSSTGLEFNFREADFGFVLSVVDNVLHLRRGGSELGRFDEWYRALVPSLASVVSTTLEAFEETFKWEDLRVLRAMCAFKVLAYGFETPDGEAPQSDSVGSHPQTGEGRIRNTRLMSSLLRQVPGEGGRLSPVSETIEDSLGRVDLKVSHWMKLANGCPVREVFDVEAPGNRDYSGLWLTYSVIGESFDVGEARSGFEFDRYLAMNGLDILGDLFMGRFVSGFLQDFLGAYVFRTSPSDVLP